MLNDKSIKYTQLTDNSLNQDKQHMQNVQWKVKKLLFICFIVTVLFYFILPHTDQKSDKSIEAGMSSKPTLEFIKEDASSAHQKATKYKILYDNHYLNFQDVIQNWKSSKTFRNEFRKTIISSEYPFVFFETPPVTYQTLTKQFEFVLVSTSAFKNAKPDYRSFSEQFKTCNTDSSACSFYNLGKDAMLIAPRGVDGERERKYVDFMSFMRNGTEREIHDFFEEVGKSAEEIVSKRGTAKTWISTSGLGVSWLHLRLDSYPKYYTFREYKKV